MGLREPSASHESSFGDQVRRYRLPCLRFVVRFVRGPCEAFVSSFGSFGDQVRRYRLPWLRFVAVVRFVRGPCEALQITVALFRREHAENGVSRRGALGVDALSETRMEPRRGDPHHTIEPGPSSESSPRAARTALFGYSGL